MDYVKLSSDVMTNIVVDLITIRILISIYFSLPVWKQQQPSHMAKGGITIEHKK